MQSRTPAGDPCRRITSRTIRAKGRREGGFFANSVIQLPNFPAVLDHAFRNRFWLIVLIVVAEIGVLILWGVMRKVERELSRK